MNAKEFLDCFGLYYLSKRKGNEKRLTAIIVLGGMSGDVYGDAMDILHEIDFVYSNFSNCAFIYELLKLTGFDEDETIYALDMHKFSGGQLLDICKNSRKVKICQVALDKKKMTEKQIEKLRRYFVYHKIRINIP